MILFSKIFTLSVLYSIISKEIFFCSWIGTVALSIITKLINSRIFCIFITLDKDLVLLYLRRHHPHASDGPQFFRNHCEVLDGRMEARASGRHPRDPDLADKVTAQAIAELEMRDYDRFFWCASLFGGPL